MSMASRSPPVASSAPKCCIFSLDEGADVGADEGTPVTEAYTVPFKFTGKIDRVTIELKPEGSVGGRALQ